jgi:hypothetical protein
MKKFFIPLTEGKTLRLWLVSFLFLLASDTLYSQTWSPPGAIWYYEYFNFGYSGYSEIKYTGDTVINSVTCKKLEKSMHVIDYLNQFQNYYLGAEYTYEQGGTIYMYFNNHFDTLFNFNASIGDSWRLAGQPPNANLCDSNSIVTVLDTGTLIINSLPLRYKKVLFNYGGSWNHPDTIIEKIGTTFWYMIPYDGCYAVDAYQGGPLRCYSDSSFAVYHHNYSNNCDFIIGLNEIEPTEDLILIYPNPVRERFTIDAGYTGGFAIEDVEIYSSVGEKIFSQKHTADSKQKKIYVDTHSWSVGIYFVRIKSESGTIVKKLVKQ